MGVSRLALAAVPAGRWRTEEGINRGALVSGRLRREEMEIQGERAPLGEASRDRGPRRARRRHGSRSTRTAQALNSAVPDSGSVASMVSTLVVTSSWKWSVMNTRPARSERSMWAGATTLPRRDVIRTGSPSACRAARHPRARCPASRPGAAATCSRRSARRCCRNRAGGRSSAGTDTRRRRVRPAGRAPRRENGAGGPSTGSSHSRPCRNCSPGCCSSEQGQCRPPSFSSRA